MLDEFDNECRAVGLTGGILLKWVRSILSHLEICQTYVIDENAMSTLLAKSEGSVVTSVFPADTFNGIYEAIKRGDTLKCKTADGVYIPCSATFFEVSGDDYKSFDFEILGTLPALSSTADLKRLKIGLESLGGAIRLHTKTVQKITATSI